VSRDAVTPEPTTKTNDAAQRRRAEIIESASHLFEEKGYAHTSMNDIADAVGVRKPTLYHYFDTKDEILYSLHEEVINPLLTKQEQRIADGVPADRMVLEIIADIMALVHEHKGHVRAYYENHRQLPERHRATSQEKRRRYQSMLEDALEQGMRDGTFRALDARLTSLAIFGTVNMAYQWYAADGSQSDRTIATMFYDLILNGLISPPLRP